jgi:hypothetical protein
MSDINIMNVTSASLPANLALSAIENPILFIAASPVSNWNLKFTSYHYAKGEVLGYGIGNADPSS